MNDNTKVKALIDTATDKIRAMVDADTVIGDAIVIGDLTLIPVSKTSFGLAAGGSDLPSKQTGEYFGGGSGAGVTITPIAFIAVKDGEAKLMPIYQSTTTADKAVALVPELFDKISALFKKPNADESAK